MSESHPKTRSNSPLSFNEMMQLIKEIKSEGLRAKLEQATDRISKKQGVILLRGLFFLVSSSILLSSLKANHKILAENTSQQIYLIVAALLISNISAAFVPRMFFVKTKFIEGLVILDILLLSFGLLISNSVQSDFYLLYFISIMVCAVSGNFLSVLVTSFLVPLIYALLAYLEFGPAVFQKTEILLRIPFLFISSIFYGYLVLLVRRESSKKAEFEKKYTSLSQTNNYIQELSNKYEKEDIYSSLLNSKTQGLDLKETSIVSRMNKKIISETNLSKTKEINKEFFEQLEKQISLCSKEQTNESDNQNLCIDIEKQNFNLIPFEGKLESDLYLAIPGKNLLELKKDKDKLSNLQTLLLHTSMGLKNANQYQALLRESDKRTDLSSQLGKALKSQADFIRNMSHELRTHISGLIGFTEIMLSDKQESLSIEQSSMLVKILQNSEKLQSLIDNIILYSRLESGEYKSNKESINSEKFFKDVIIKHKKHIDKKVVKIYLEFENDLPILVLDWELLSEVLDTFIANAIKYTPEGEINVISSYDEQKEELSVEIKDSGIGIDKDRLTSIFAPFNQIDASYSQKQQASNLNLAIVKKQVEMMDGEIRAKSKVGKGTSFKITVPARQSIGKKLPVLKLDSVPQENSQHELKT